MKSKVSTIVIFLFVINNLTAQINNISLSNPTLTPAPNLNIHQRTCGTDVPGTAWDNWFNQKVAEFQANNPSGRLQTVNYTIPVIIHVIHGGQAVGSYPNLPQGQLNSQITVLNQDYAGNGMNVGNIPSVFANAKANTGISFCLAKKNPNGVTLAEPGIDRINYVSKGWADPASSSYATQSTFQSYIDGTIKPGSIWNPALYLNIWVTDCNSALPLLGYATLPAGSGLTGLSNLGTATTDGVWLYSGAFGSSSLASGFYAAPYDKGRTATHEIGHYLGLRHMWGDGTCLTDYCNDTPPAQTANYNCPTFPYNSGVCSGNTTGEMTMNFMDYTDDACMYLFTNDQNTRIQTAMLNGTYRNQLNASSANLCTFPIPIANFSVTPNPTCIGTTINITDLSTNNPTAWSYTLTGGTPSLSTAQNPTVSYLSAGIYSITLISSNGTGSSTAVVKTVTVNTAPTITLSSSPSTTICAGTNLTITPSGATNYTLVNTGATSVPFIVNPTAATVYSVTAMNSGANICRRTQTLSIIINTVNITISPTATSVCLGNSAFLSGSGATTYTWNTNVQTSTISVLPTTTTIYTLSGTNLGCIGTKTVQVSINPSPTVTAFNTTICIGGTAILQASGATTYTWNTGSTASTITVTPSTNTTYTVTGTNTFGCVNTTTASVTTSTVLSINIASTPTSVCPGSSSTLTASGATSYTWNTGATSSSIFVSPTTTTNYTVNGASGSCVGSNTISILVNSLPTITATANSGTICLGNGTNLNATGATNYTWYPGGFVSPTYSISPSSTTLYTVTGINTSGCISSETVNVTVNSLPVINISASPTSVCLGQSSILTGAGAATYTWNTGVQSSSINVSPTAATIYTLTGTNFGCNGTSTIQVNTNPLPNISVNNATICIGGLVNLSASGASSYTWNTGATTSTISVSPTSNTNYTVTGTSSLGCNNTSTASVIIANGLSVNIAASSTSICSGGSSTLTASGATSYTWNTGSNNAGIIVSPSTGTNYTVNAQSGTCAGSSTIHILVNASPTVTALSSASVVCIGQQVYLTAYGANTYSWSSGATSSISVVNPIVSTIYTVTGTTNNCSSSTTLMQNVSNCTGINQISKIGYNIIVYPNPFKDELTISAGELINIQLYNTLGQLIVVKTINETGTINTTEFAKGVYYIVAKGNSGNKTLKIVKE